MKQLFDQLVQFVQQGITAIFRFVQLIWNWSIGQISQVLQSPWQSWPLWKQIVLVLIAAGVVWALYKAAKDLWEAGEKLLGAFAMVLGVLIKTLPSVLVAGLISLSGVWLLNNVDLSAIRLPSAFQMGAR
jgi:hypothetical protein